MLCTTRVFFFFFTRNSSSSGPEAVLTTAAGQPVAQGGGLQSSQSPTRLWLLERGATPIFKKKRHRRLHPKRSALFSVFVFRSCARQVWPLPWHLPKCCSEILSITGLEVSEGIPNMAQTHVLSRRINRYLTPQTVISHHEARLSANSLCPVLQIYAAFYTSESVYIELQHYATSTNPNSKLLFFFHF